MNREIYLIENPFRKSLINIDSITELNNDLIDDGHEKYEIKNRRTRLDAGKCYVRIYKCKKYKRRLSAVISIGKDIIELLNFNPLKNVIVSYFKNNKNIIEISQNQSDNGYKLSFATGSNVLRTIFTLPDEIHFHPTETREVLFDFTSTPSLIINLEKIINDR